ncbi:leucyl aminopeptidase [Candidatus Parcubacteria bacterium]|nr:MAG: leucyl aminopeptidase [Candidatus Parcubacteria bacterium]
MELILKNIGEELDESQVLFCPVLEGKEATLAMIKSLLYEDEKLIFAQAARENFLAKKGQSLVITDDTQTVILLGTGIKKKLSVEDWRQLAGQMIAHLRKIKAKKISLHASHWLKGNKDVSLLGQAIAEGLDLANYSFDKYKKADKNKINPNIEELIVYLEDKHKNDFSHGFEYGSYLAWGTTKARDLVNEPANHMTPSFLAEQAQEIAALNKNITVKILDKEQIAKLKMNAFLAVDKGSIEDPKFIHLKYKPNVKAKDKIALVGKGITFDSGGLSIKPGEAMEQMKIDMAGAATVIGLFSVIAQVAPKVEVHGIIAACENMPSGSAIKPGDIVTNMQGKSIEIANTDAEGRVTLADSLAYAQKQGIKQVVDLATLTGAVMVALGPDYAGLFANDAKLANDILTFADRAGEKMWQLPLPKEYKKLNQSKVADIRNIPSTRYGGAITAALFLEEFINKDTKWAHLDIAAPAYAERPVNIYTPLGGVGFGVRTLLEWLKNM